MASPWPSRLPSVIYNETTGTPEGRHLLQVKNLLKFPIGESGSTATPVKIDVILPGSEVTQTFTLTPAAISLPDPLASPARSQPILYQVSSNFGYASWANFDTPEQTLAMFRGFLAEVKAQKPKGLILDLRGNTGGWDVESYTMASYFFNADKPASLHWIDQSS